MCIPNLKCLDSPIPKTRWGLESRGCDHAHSEVVWHPTDNSNVTYLCTKLEDSTAAIPKVWRRAKNVNNTYGWVGEVRITQGHQQCHYSIKRAAHGFLFTFRWNYMYTIWPRCSTLKRPVVTHGVAWSVGLSVGHDREPCKNGWTDWYAVWVVDLGGPKEARVR